MVKKRKALMIAGYASIFDTPDSDGDTVQPGAYLATLDDYTPSMLWNHDSNKPLGGWTRITEDTKGLWAAGFITDPSTIELIEEGVLTALSIGYKVRLVEHPPSGGRLLHRVELIEISLVTTPMHPHCRFTIRETETT